MSATSSTIRQCVALLEALGAPGPHRPGDLAAEVGINRTSLQRLLNTLLTRGLVVRRDGGYDLDTYMRVISDRTLPALRGAAFNAIRELADACHETVALYVLDGDGIVVLDEALAPTDHGVRVRHPVGTREPLLDAAAGRALLAFGSAELRRKAIARAPASEAVIAEARDAGHATGLHADAPIADLAVPVLSAAGDAIASLAVLAPASRRETLAGHLPALRRAAARIGELRRTDDDALAG